MTLLKESALCVWDIMDKLLEKAKVNNNTQTYFMFDLVEEISGQLWNVQKILLQFGKDHGIVILHRVDDYSFL